MSVYDFKNQISRLSQKLNPSNFRDIKKEIIEIQNKISRSELISAHRQELRELSQKLFDSIQSMQSKEQEEFEKEAEANYTHIKEKLIQCIEFVERESEDHESCWELLINTQEIFRGKKLRQEQREYLYNALQKLFEIVKNRKEEKHKALTEQSEVEYKNLDTRIKEVLLIAETEEIQSLWNSLMVLSNELKSSNMVFSHKKKLNDRLQEAFTMAKLRKEDQRNEEELIMLLNAEKMEKDLKDAEKIIKKEIPFKEKWDTLIAIQNNFRNLRLDRDSRDQLYDTLQNLFDSVKQKQNKKNEDFEKEADENYEFLNKEVIQAMETAHNSMEFNKAKGFLIKVQSEFKGKKMRSEQREWLYSRLQTAFETLKKRLDNYIAQQKDVREFRNESQISDVKMKMDQLQDSIESDYEKLEIMQTSFEDSKLLGNQQREAESLVHQVEMMQASIKKKENELKNTESLMEKLTEKRLRLENLDQNSSERPNP